MRWMIRGHQVERRNCSLRKELSSSCIKVPSPSSLSLFIFILWTFFLIFLHPFDSRLLKSSNPLLTLSLFNHFSSLARLLITSKNSSLKSSSLTCASKHSTQIHVFHSLEPSRIASPSELTSLPFKSQGIPILIRI